MYQGLLLDANTRSARLKVANTSAPNFEQDIDAISFLIESNIFTDSRSFVELSL
jgi:hypothetical protein